MDKSLMIIDDATEMPVFAVRTSTAWPQSDGAQAVWKRAGYGVATTYVLLVDLQSDECHSDPYAWNAGRTMRLAHQELLARWDDYVDGDRLDVRQTALFQRAALA